MGHDITAYNPLVDREAIGKEFNEIPHDHPNWCEEFDAYRKSISVAELRRSAGNPLNQVIYLALGVHDEAYAGCSGNGIALDITVGQFCTAISLIRKKQFAQMTRPTNMADDILNLCADAGMPVVRCGTKNADSAQPEIEFCSKCIDFCEDNGLDSLEVMFG